MKVNLEKPVIGQNWYLVKGNVSQTIIDERLIPAKTEREASIKFNNYNNGCGYNLKMTLIGPVTQIDIDNWKIKMDYFDSIQDLNSGL